MLSSYTQHLRRLALVSMLWQSSICSAASADDEIGSENNCETQAFYVAPQKAGDGHGNSAAGPADFRDMHFWSVVQRALKNAPTVVNFLDGTYAVSADKQKSMPTLALADLGSEKYPLTLQGI